MGKTNRRRDRRKDLTYQEEDDHSMDRHENKMARRKNRQIAKYISDYVDDMHDLTDIGSLDINDDLWEDPHYN